MRKLIVSNMMSLNGYYAGPDNSVLISPSDGAFFNAYTAERLRAADTLLLGRTTYDLFRGFWPPLADDPSVSSTQREVSRLNNAINKVVVSDSMTPEDTEPWQNNTRIIKRADAHAQLAELKYQSGKDIFVFASNTLWNDLLAHGLVDELHLMIGPAVLSAGRPIVAGQSTVSLRLIDTCTQDGSGVVLVRYEICRQTT